MAVKSGTWQSVLIGLSAVNLVAVGFAAGDGEPWHSALHAALALVFGLWAQRRSHAGSRHAADPSLPGEADRARLDVVERDLAQIRQELSETQERLDFAERVLVKGRGDGAE